LPSWVTSDTYLYAIDARAKGDAPKDQVRLMMQSLLASRFKLVVHFETREVSASVLTLASPGRTGPQLRPHSEGAFDFTLQYTEDTAPNPDGLPPSLGTTLTSALREQLGLKVVSSREPVRMFLIDHVERPSEN